MDERATLEELERLREQVERCRARRRAVGDEFDRFVGSFRKAPAPAPPPDRSARQRPRLGGLDDVQAPARSNAAIQTAPPHVDRRAKLGTGIAIGGTILLLVVGALVIWWLRARAPAGDTAGGATPPTRVPAAATPVAALAAPSVAGSELTTTRPVWVRVVADGKTILERQLAANTRVPVAAQKTIVIRAGDAGAVRLRIRGQDQGPLGGAGEVVTRRFEVPARQ